MLIEYFSHSLHALLRCTYIVFVVHVAERFYIVARATPLGNTRVSRVCVQLPEERVVRVVSPRAVLPLVSRAGGDLDARFDAESL